jgi:hypothetical protein
VTVAYFDFHLWSILLIVTLGILFGASECRVNGACPLRRLFWMLAAAVVFFVPLSALWFLQSDKDQGGSILMIGALWVIFLVSRVAGAYIYESVIDGKEPD